MSVQQLYEKWSQQSLPEYLAEELATIASNEQEMEERFYRYIPFGTAGMRGVLGAGTNRMNIYTIRRVSEGLARYVIANGELAKIRGVVIAYDTRHFSYEFACETARVLGTHGIQTYIYKEARPTPQLSFTVRKLNAYAGVMITASHNPKEYNGFKMFGEDGAQLTPQLANEITVYMSKIDDIFSIKAINIEVLEEQGLLTWLGADLDEAYVEQLLTLKEQHEMALDMKLVYTPIHGAGLVPVRESLRAFGFRKVVIVEQQAVQDGSFPTVNYPNPEEEAAFTLAMELGQQIGAKLLLATDPDADRLGVAVWNGIAYKLLTGNQLGALLLYYLLATKQQNGTLPSDGIIVKTVVTAELGVKIAESFGIATENTLTGFKYIAEKIAQFEATGEQTFIFGYEESYGYLIETFVRDKDAVQIALKVAEMTAFYAMQGYTLLDQLEYLYKKFGYYKEEVLSKQFEGKNGQAEMGIMLQRLREIMPKEIGGKSVKCVEDYLVGKATFRDGMVVTLTLPRENVLKFILEDDSWIAIRPSGTEPKCKFYIGVVGETNELVQQKFEMVKQSVLLIVKQ